MLVDDLLSLVAPMNTKVNENPASDWKSYKSQFHMTLNKESTYSSQAGPFWKMCVKVAAAEDQLEREVTPHQVPNARSCL